MLLSAFTPAYAQDIEQRIETINAEMQAHQLALQGLSRKSDSLKLQYVQEKLSTMGFPSEDEIVHHSAFALAYDEEHEQARWVAHMILPDVKEGSAGRTNDFRTDPLVATGTAVDLDYFVQTTDAEGKKVYDSFGFDRGHLAPSADFRWNEAALSESYFYSNLSPQLPEFNRESWAAVEDLIREYVVRTGHEVYVVTGPVLHASLPKMERSPNKVSVPAYFFKVAIDLESLNSIGFYMPNQKCTLPTENYVKTIDEIESLTGLNFFPSLSTNEADLLEGKVSLGPWLPADDKLNVKMLEAADLEPGQFNTLQAYEWVDTGKKVSICGTVVSTFKSSKGNVFINLDRRFPNAVFTVNMWSSDLKNFSFAPEKELADKRICINGEVLLRDGIPQINCTSEKQIFFLNEL